ncbi:MAG: T9SS type A sorting domain-containing protein [Bacteroidota bacterium]
MKTLLSFVIVCSSFLVLAQNYQLFNANSKKEFISDSTATETYSISFDSVLPNGSETVYYNHVNVDMNQNIMPDSCYFWCSWLCSPQNKPSGMGPRVINYNNNHYKFFTSYGDTLGFNFKLDTGDTSLIYMDSAQKLYMIYAGVDTATILNIIDSVKSYKILLLDSVGNTISSLLNNKSIRIGKAFGMIDFIRTDYFPVILQPLILIGNISPDAGFYKLTNELLYDYQAGDEIQYVDSYMHWNGNPGGNYQRYLKYTILNRINTSSTISYLVARYKFEIGLPALVYDTITLNYNKYDFVAVIPYDHFDQPMYLRTFGFSKQDYCGLSLWTYSGYSGGYLAYCSADNCWGCVDVGGYPTETRISYVLGLGLYENSVEILSVYSHGQGINYFKKNGVTCGTQVTLAINDPNATSSGITIYPNPASQLLFIQSVVDRKGTVSIMNLMGQELMTTALSGQKTKLDLGNLEAGVYLVKITSGSNTFMKKIIKR